MSLKQQAKILGTPPSYLSMMKTIECPWKPEIKASYEQLSNSLPKSVHKTSKKESVVRGGVANLLGSKVNSGGAEEARTPDPLLAKQVLSQLSYSPLPIVRHCH